MGFWNRLARNKQSTPAPLPEPQFVAPGAPAPSPKVVVVDNTSSNDNWLTNRTTSPVTVACKEMFGAFAVNLGPGETKRITFNVEANVYPAGQYAYDDLKYEIGKGEKWEIRGEPGRLSMVKVDA